MKCSDCNENIDIDDKTANGPAGLIHYECFKRSTAHGIEIDYDDEINKLKKRVQDLEKQIENLETNNLPIN